MLSNLISTRSWTIAKRAVIAAAILRYLKDFQEVYSVLQDFRHTRYEDTPHLEDEADQAILREYEDNDNLVSDDEFENVLEELNQELGDSDLGLFSGPDDPALAIMGEIAAGFGGVRAVALQVSHPFIAKGVLVHSNVQTNPYDRAIKTQKYTLGMLFGTRREVFASARIVRGLHRKVKGEIGENIGIFKTNTQFDAAQRDAIRWVAATMPETVELGLLMLKREMTREEKQAVLNLNIRFMKCFGVSSPKIPKDWDGFQHYYRAMMRSRLLVTSEASFELIDTLSIPPYPWIAPLNWLLTWFVYIQLPPRLGEKFYGRKYTQADMVLFSLLVAQNRFLYRLLPDWLRCITAFHNLKIRAGTDKHWPWTRWVIQRVGDVGMYLIYFFMAPREKETVQRIMMEKKLARNEKLQSQAS